MTTWQRLADQSNKEYDVSDFEQAAYRLMVEQVLYASDRLSKVSYCLIVKHLNAFRELLSQLGMEVTHNAHHTYVVAIPSRTVAEKMRLSETQMALVLRRMYDDRMMSADIIEGEGHVSLEELELAYKEWLPFAKMPDKRGEMRTLAMTLKRYGIVRIEDVEDGQPFRIVIRPGIVDVLGETALLQLATYAPERVWEDDDETF